MNVLVRVDAYDEIALGHLSRCIELGKELADLNNKVIFLCYEDDSAKARLKDSKAKFKLLPFKINEDKFLEDEIQILESKAFGADCILLIASILDKNKIKDFYQIAKENELDVLIEVHDEKEAEIAMAVSPALLGINNRDLKTFDVDINNSIKIKEMLPKSQLIISESGIYSRDDINDLNEAKIYNFLVGEFFMRKKEPYKAVQDLIALSPISSR